MNQIFKTSLKKIFKDVFIQDIFEDSNLLFNHNEASFTCHSLDLDPDNLDLTRHNITLVSGIVSLFSAHIPLNLSNNIHINIDGLSIHLRLGHADPNLVKKKPPQEPDEFKPSIDSLSLRDLAPSHSDPSSSQDFITEALKSYLFRLEVTITNITILLEFATDASNPSPHRLLLAIPKLRYINVDEHNQLLISPDRTTLCFPDHLYATNNPSPHPSSATSVPPPPANHAPLLKSIVFHRLSLEWLPPSLSLATPSAPVPLLQLSADEAHPHILQFQFDCPHGSDTVKIALSNLSLIAHIHALHLALGPAQLSILRDVLPLLLSCLPKPSSESPSEEDADADSRDPPLNLLSSITSSILAQGLGESLILGESLQSSALSELLHQARMSLQGSHPFFSLERSPPSNPDPGFSAFLLLSSLSLTLHLSPSSPERFQLLGTRLCVQYQPASPTDRDQPLKISATLATLAVMEYDREDNPLPVLEFLPASDANAHPQSAAFGDDLSTASPDLSIEADLFPQYTNLSVRLNSFYCAINPDLLLGLYALFSPFIEDLFPSSPSSSSTPNSGPTTSLHSSNPPVDSAGESTLNISVDSDLIFFRVALTEAPNLLLQMESFRLQITENLHLSFHSLAFQILPPGVSRAQKQGIVILEIQPSSNPSISNTLTVISNPPTLPRSIKSIPNWGVQLKPPPDDPLLLTASTIIDIRLEGLQLFLTPPLIALLQAFIAGLTLRLDAFASAKQAPQAAESHDHPVVAVPTTLCLKLKTNRATFNLFADIEINDQVESRSLQFIFQDLTLLQVVAYGGVRMHNYTDIQASTATLFDWHQNRVLNENGSLHLRQHHQYIARITVHTYREKSPFITMEFHRMTVDVRFLQGVKDFLSLFFASEDDASTTSTSTPSPSTTPTSTASPPPSKSQPTRFTLELSDTSFLLTPEHLPSRVIVAVRHSHLANPTAANEKTSSWRIQFTSVKIFVIDDESRIIHRAPVISTLTEFWTLRGYIDVAGLESLLVHLRTDAPSNSSLLSIRISDVDRNDSKRLVSPGTIRIVSCYDSLKCCIATLSQLTFTTPPAPSVDVLNQSFMPASGESTFSSSSTSSSSSSNAMPPPEPISAEIIRQLQQAILVNTVPVPPTTPEPMFKPFSSLPPSPEPLPRPPSISSFEMQPDWPPGFRDGDAWFARGRWLLPGGAAKLVIIEDYSRPIPPQSLLALPAGYPTPDFHLAIHPFHISFRLYSGTDFILDSNPDRFQPIDRSSFLEILLESVSLTFFTFDRARSGDTSAHTIKSRLALQALHATVLAQLPDVTAPWVSTLSAKPGPTSAGRTPFISLLMDSVVPDQTSHQPEYRLAFRILPISVHLHQLVIDFLLRVMGTNADPTSRFSGAPSSLSNSGAVIGEEPDPFFIQYLHLGSVSIDLHYHPRPINLRTVGSVVVDPGQHAPYVELINILQLEGINILLPTVLLNGINGFPDALKQLKITYGENFEFADIIGLYASGAYNSFSSKYLSSITSRSQYIHTFLKTISSRAI